MRITSHSRIPFTLFRLPQRLNPPLSLSLNTPLPVLIPLPTHPSVPVDPKSQPLGCAHAFSCFGFLLTLIPLIPSAPSLVLVVAWLARLAGLSLAARSLSQPRPARARFSSWPCRPPLASARRRPSPPSSASPSFRPTNSNVQRSPRCYEGACSPCPLLRQPALRARRSRRQGRTRATPARRWTSRSQARVSTSKVGPDGLTLLHLLSAFPPFCSNA